MSLITLRKLLIVNMLKASNIDENVAKKFIDLYLKSMDNHNVFKLYDKMSKIF